MSEIIVETFTDKTTEKTIGSEYITDGTAKSWANFQGTGTVAVRDSLNVSSITDVNTGTYDINYSSSMGSDDYVTSMDLTVSASGGACRGVNGNGPATGHFSMYTANAAQSAVQDADEVYTIMIGDLA